MRKLKRVCLLKIFIYDDIFFFDYRHNCWYVERYVKWKITV